MALKITKIISQVGINNKAEIELVGRCGKCNKDIHTKNLICFQCGNVQCRKSPSIVVPTIFSTTI